MYLRLKWAHWWYGSPEYTLTKERLLFPVILKDTIGEELTAEQLILAVWILDPDGNKWNPDNDGEPLALIKKSLYSS